MLDTEESPIHNKLLSIRRVDHKIEATRRLHADANRGNSPVTIGMELDNAVSEMEGTDISAVYQVSITLTECRWLAEALFNFIRPKEMICPIA